METILIEGIRLYAYHGCMKEEAAIGGNYIVDISIEADLKKASSSDRLNDTIDYVSVFEVVKKEMAIPSKLIEHVAKRILDRLKKKFPKTGYMQVKVAKLNPPVSGEVEKVSVLISE